MKDVAKLIKGADFPTGGMICGKQGHQGLPAHGPRQPQGARARIGIEEVKGGKERLIISEIPYNVNKATLIEQHGGLVNEKKLDDISDIRDESDKDGIRVVIELKRGDSAGCHQQSL